MNLEEINALTLESIVNGIAVSDTLKNRLYILALASLAEGEELLFEDFAPSQAELDAELLLYKSELNSIESERLRVEDLKLRIEALHDMPYAHAILRSDIPNAALWVKKNILENQDHAEAETLMVELEQKDLELKTALDEAVAARELLSQKKSDFKAKANNQITLPELVEIVKSLL